MTTQKKLLTYPDDQALERAGDEGRFAHGKGVSSKDNPYPKEDQRHEWWNDGWEGGMYAAPSQSDMNAAASASRDKESDRLDRELVEETSLGASTFRHDGYRDAKEGLPPNPPTHPRTNVYESEYMEGYTAFGNEQQGDLTEAEASDIIAAALNIRVDQLMSIAEMEFQPDAPEYRVRLLNGDLWTIAPGPGMKLSVTSPSGRTSLFQHERKLSQAELVRKYETKLEKVKAAHPGWKGEDYVAFAERELAAVKAQGLDGLKALWQESKDRDEPESAPSLGM